MRFSAAPRQKLARQGSQASCEARDEDRSNKERDDQKFNFDIIKQEGSPTDHAVGGYLLKHANV